MSTSSEWPAKQKNKTTYILDPESEMEMARLMEQDQLITQGMGGIFPENLNLDNVEQVLDLACGPGSWVLDVAFTYRDMEVVGVDISEKMIRYATMRAESQRRKNASFKVMNILEPFSFPDHSFDLINARLISGFMHQQMWPKLFSECLRILRPGGILRLTEIEGGPSNKAAFAKANHTIQEAMALIGHNFSPDGLHYGIIQMLPRFFQDAGLQEIGKMAHALNYSAGTPVRDAFYYDLIAVCQSVEPLIVKTQLATAEEWRALSSKGLAEMFEEDFCALWILLTVWGQKPSQVV